MPRRHLREGAWLRRRRTRLRTSRKVPPRRRWSPCRRHCSHRSIRSSRRRSTPRVRSSICCCNSATATAPSNARAWPFRRAGGHALRARLLSRRHYRRADAPAKDQHPRAGAHPRGAARGGVRRFQVRDGGAADTPSPPNAKIRAREGAGVRRRIRRELSAVVSGGPTHQRRGPHRRAGRRGRGGGRPRRHHPDRGEGESYQDLRGTREAAHHAHGDGQARRRQSRSQKQHTASRGHPARRRLTREGHAMANDMQAYVGAEFQALPLDFIMAAPLTAAVKAQAAAAEAARGFFEAMLDDNGAPKTVQFQMAVKQNDGASKDVQINAPLLSLVPVPHLRIDSLTVHFKYEITQSLRSSKATDAEVGIQMGIGKTLTPWAEATLKGSGTSKSAEESTTNRSGQLEITLHASEAPMPEGLARLLNLLAKSVDIPPPA